MSCGNPQCPGERRGETRTDDDHGNNAPAADKGDKAEPGQPDPKHHDEHGPDYCGTVGHPAVSCLMRCGG